MIIAQRFADLIKQFKIWIRSEFLLVLMVDVIIHVLIEKVKSSLISWNDDLILRPIIRNNIENIYRDKAI